MTREHDRSDSSSLRGISRRQFLKLAAAGLLTGCRSAQRPVVTSIAAPTAAPTSAPTATPVPTHTRRPTRTPTSTPTLVPTAVIRRPKVIKAHPEVPSKVVRARHSGVWEGETLLPGAIRQMLDAAITELTGLNDAHEAWASLFAPDERIAIKVNTIVTSLFWTHVPLVMTLTECLQEAGIPAEQIFVFDRDTSELKNAGYAINYDGPGVRCYGTEEHYSAGWKLLGLDVRLSNILLTCNAVINVPILKPHSLSGITFGMKNHYGTYNRPEAFHRSDLIVRGIAGINALQPIRDRTRLIIGDVLAACLREASSWPHWRATHKVDTILMSFDPVAHDTVGLEMFSRLSKDNGHEPVGAQARTNSWLANGAELGLGTNDPEHIELVDSALA